MSDLALQTTGMNSPSNSAEALLSQAVAAGANIDTLERLIALREKVLAEKSKEAFNTAMAAFQAECPVITKDKAVKDRNDKVIYHYAPLDSIVSQVKKIIEKHGFSYSFKTKQSEGNITVVCFVKHKLGWCDHSDVMVPTTGGTSIMSGPQKVAAALTFAKRYAFCDAFGIMTGDEDNDTASERGDQPKRPPQNTAKTQFVPAKPVELKGPASAEQVTEIATLARQLGGDVPTLYAKLKIKGQPTKKQAMDMIDALRKKKAKLETELSEAEEKAKVA